MTDDLETKRQRAHAYNRALAELKERHRGEWREIYDRIWAELQDRPVPRVRQGGTWERVCACPGGGAPDDTNHYPDCPRNPGAGEGETDDR